MTESAVDFFMYCPRSERGRQSKEGINFNLTSVCLYLQMRWWVRTHWVLIHVDRKALRQPCNLRRSWQDVASCLYSSRSARNCRSCIVQSDRYFDEQVISTGDLSGHYTETGLTAIYTVNFGPVETRGFTLLAIHAAHTPFAYVTQRAIGCNRMHLVLLARKQLLRNYMTFL
jgi:hypothetical protein